MVVAILSPDRAWSQKFSDGLLKRCASKGRYVEVETFCSFESLDESFDKKPFGTVIMSADRPDELEHAERIGQKGVRLILLTDSNDVAVKAYSILPDYCTYKCPDEEDLDRISSVIFRNHKRE